MHLPVLGVDKRTLELLEKGKYDEVFEKPKYVENINAEQSGASTTHFYGKSIFFVIVSASYEIESAQRPIKILRKENLAV